jgi:hypothetical protein
MCFADALALSDKLGGKRHVLLGNGFSIAYDPESFSYGRLLDEADFSALSIDACAVFEAFGTADFERIIEVLRTAAIMLRVYAASDPALADRIAADAERLKDALAEVLARRHPDNVGSLQATSYEHARVFLNHFERIYTVNYDLLLYWTTMQDMEPSMPRNDGFMESEDSPGADYVAWQPMVTYTAQRIFYLHGALHLFDAGTELRKLTWTRTGVALVDQIRGALTKNIYPLVVTEGSTEEKYEKILHSAYLNHAMRSFSSIQGCLFVYGLSLTPNDQHVLRRIEDGKSSALFVGLYGDPDGVGNRKIVERANHLAVSRDSLCPLAVHFFDAASAEVWRPAS